MKNIINGIFKENPVFVLLLGLCSTLAITTKFENAYVMGFALLFVLLISNFIVSIIKKLIPDNVRIPVYILIISTVVTIVELLLQKYVPDLHQVLGIYIPLITVNCIVLGRALSVASKKSIVHSLTDAIGIGLGFTLALMLIAFIREVLGNNTLTIFEGLSNITNMKLVYSIFPSGNLIPMKFLVEPSGAFLVLGILIAIFKKVGDKHESN